MSSKDDSTMTDAASKARGHRVSFGSEEGDSAKRLKAAEEMDISMDEDVSPEQRKPPPKPPNDRQLEAAPMEIMIDEEEEDPPPTKPPPKTLLDRLQQRTLKDYAVVTKTPPTAQAQKQQQRADLGLSANYRRHRIFYDFSFPVKASQSGSKDLVADARIAASKMLGTLYSVDDSIVLYPYNTDSEADRFAKAIDGKGFASRLPKTQNKIDKYIDGFRVRGEAEYVMYTRILLGCDGDEDALENFVLSATALTREANGSFYRKTLQAAETTTVGFLLNTHEKINVEDFQHFLALQVHIFDKQRQSGNPRQTPLMVGVTRRTIWDGIRKKDRPKNYRATQALHVEFLKGQTDEGRLLVKAVLLSQACKARSNLPFPFIKALKPQDARKEKMQHAILRHRGALDSIEHVHSTDFAVLDKQMECKDLKGSLLMPNSDKVATMRRLLLDMKSDKTGKSLFLTVEKDRTGAGVWFSFPKSLQQEATARIAGLPLYLHKTVDDPRVLKWFTPMALERMLEMEWDPEHARVITPEEREMTQALEMYDGAEFDWVEFDLATLLADEAKKQELRLQLQCPDQGKDYDAKSVATTGTNNTTAQAAAFLRELEVNSQAGKMPPPPDDLPPAAISPSNTTDPRGTPPQPGPPGEGGTRQG